MPSLAQRLREEGEKVGVKKGVKQGVKQGVKKAKLETAKELVKNGVDIDIIARSTGLSKKEIELLAETVH